MLGSRPGSLDPATMRSPVDRVGDAEIGVAPDAVPSPSCRTPDRFYVLPVAILFAPVVGVREVDNEGVDHPASWESLRAAQRVA